MAVRKRGSMQPNEPNRQGVMPNTPNARRRTSLGSKPSRPVVGGYVSDAPAAQVSYNSGGQPKGGGRMRKILIITVIFLAVLGLAALAAQLFLKPGSPQNLSDATGVSFASINTPKNFTASKQGDMHFLNTTDNTCSLSYGLVPSKTFKSTKISEIMTEIVNPIRIAGSDVSNPIDEPALPIPNARGDVTYSMPTRQFTTVNGLLISTSRYSIAQVANKKFVVVVQSCTSSDGTEPIAELDQKLKSTVQTLQLQTDPATSKQ